MLDVLGNKGCTVVLIEITAEIRVIASTTVIRRVTAPIHLIKGMTAIIGVFGWRTSGFVAPPPTRSSCDQPIEMIIVIWPND